MHQALYRKWRPQIFDDVCGQEHITSILKYETSNNKFSHAYLFCGSRGTGKTTCAKILSKAVNCESPINGNPCNCCPSCVSIDMGTTTDVIEMDAASNNGVDNIRDIRDEVMYTPSGLKYRVYIVDEVHMLSASAFNALLKTLEEPPAHAVFILATTEMQKLPATIISRCQRYDFRRITTDAIIDRLSLICDAENFEYTRDALRIIAKMAQGGMRDAISLLELCAGTRRKITADMVNDTLGVGGRDVAEKVLRAISDGDFEVIFSAIDEVIRSSKDISVFLQELMTFCRDILVVKTTTASKEYLDLTDDEYSKFLLVASGFTKESLLYYCRVLDEAFSRMQKSGETNRIIVEMTLIKLCESSVDNNYDAILSRLSKLESTIMMGEFAHTFSYSESNLSDKSQNFSEDEDNICSTMKNNPKGPLTDDLVCHEKASLKALRGWNEVIEQASASDPALLGFLKGAKAFIDSEENIFIRFPNQFAMGMALAKASTKVNLRAALSVKLKKNIAENSVHYEVFKGNESEFEELDDLNF